MTRCRDIHADDIGNVVVLLTRGFAGSTPSYWERALKRLTNHSTPPGYPKYGYVIEDTAVLVGVVLLIYSGVQVNGACRIRCNVSSWYVEPAYRVYGSLLASCATKHKTVTYFNMSPAPNTWRILEQQGFMQFATGRTIAVPVISRSPSGARVQAVMPGIRPGPDLDQSEINLLIDHAGYGCLSLVCDVDDCRHPFVFRLERRYGFLPIAHLVYCRNIGDFIRFAGSLGRWLALRGCIFVNFLSSAPTRGIVGRHVDGRPKFRKGSDIGVGDVAYSEEVMFE